FGTDDLRERANLVKYCGAIIPGSARVSRVGESVSLSRTFLKIVSARRRNQHARRVRYPESPSRACSIFRASNQQRSDKRLRYRRISMLKAWSSLTRAATRRSARRPVLRALSSAAEAIEAPGITQSFG